MNVAIIAGGKGTRIAEYYPNLPKPMIPLCGKPILEWQIETLAKQDFDDITLIVGYKSDVIKDYFGNGENFGVNVKYIAEDNPLGTGGALILLPKDDTLILFGDLFCDVDFNRFVSYHNDKNADITLFAHPNSHMHDSDIIVTDDSNKVTMWASKKDPNRRELRNLVNAGIYVLNSSMLPTGEAKKLDLERDIIIPALNKYNIYAYRSTEYVKDLGTPERLAQVETYVKSGMSAARSFRNKQKAIFLDRDGTINVYDGLVTNPEQLRLVDGAVEAINLINQSEYLAICITNQPVIARGDVTFEELNTIHARLDNLLGKKGAFLDDLLFCPHHTDKGFEGERIEYKIKCDCRKPKPGMLLRAAELYNIDLSKSYMIGDNKRDIDAGTAAGCGTFLVNENNNIFDIVQRILDS